jgi:glutamate/tyrosine decarboxylase-like PLP-dependent enzyme
MGTTGLCSYDCLPELGRVCRDAGSMWLHVDAAYAGAALACPEYRPQLLPGLEYADSFNFDPHKMMLVNFDCAAMWFRDASLFDTAFNVQTEMLRHEHSGGGEVPDYRHWQIPFGRRFRALKLWFVLRLGRLDFIAVNTSVTAARSLGCTDRREYERTSAGRLTWPRSSSDCCSRTGGSGSSSPYPSASSASSGTNPRT